jgi:hypothetical protein
MESVAKFWGVTFEFHKSIDHHFIEYTLSSAEIMFIEAASNPDEHQTIECKFCILRYQNTLRPSVFIRAQNIRDSYPLSKLHYQLLLQLF